MYLFFLILIFLFERKVWPRTDTYAVILSFFSHFYGGRMQRCDMLLFSDLFSSAQNAVFAIEVFVEVSLNATYLEAQLDAF